MPSTRNGDLLDAFESAFPDTGFVFDTEGEIVRAFAGPEVDLLVGDVEGLVGTRVRDAFRSETAEKIENQIQRTVDTQTLQTREYIIEGETGARSFDARMAPVETGADDELVAALFRDVTTRDLYAQRLDENNRILNTIQQSTQAVGHANTVAELRESICDVITDASPYQLAWIGRHDPERDEFVSLTTTGTEETTLAVLDESVADQSGDSVPPPPIAATERRETQVVQNIHDVSATTAWRADALREGFHSIGAFPILNGDEVDSVLTVYAHRPYAFGFNERQLFEELCRDIAHAEEALAAQQLVRDQQAEIQAQNVEWEILNRIVRHDIRNKMSVVLGRGELLADSLAGALSDEQQTHLQQLLDNSQQVVDITKEARDVAEALANSGHVDLDDVSLAETLRTEVETIGQAYPEATVVLANDVPEVTVRANEFLGSVFRNVITNAIIHNDTPERRVEVATAVTDDSVVVDVVDEGPGIPEYVRKDVLEGTGKIADSEGHGIGLNLVTSLVNQYGGAVRVTDNQPRGSVVTVELPR